MKLKVFSNKSKLSGISKDLLADTKTTYKGRFYKEIWIKGANNAEGTLNLAYNITKQLRRDLKCSIAYKYERNVGGIVGYLMPVLHKCLQLGEADTIKEVYFKNFLDQSYLIACERKSCHTVQQCRGSQSSVGRSETLFI